jgi:hypothetical protein
LAITDAVVEFVVFEHFGPNPAIDAPTGARQSGRRCWD